MREWTAVAVLCAILGLSAPVQGGDADPFRALLDRYEAALRKQDVTAVVALYEADGDFVSFAGQQASGSAELREFYSGAVSGGGLDHKSTIDQVRRLSKSAAVVDGTFEVRQATGTPLRGRWTAVVTNKGSAFRFKAVRTWIPSRGRAER